MAANNYSSPADALFQSVEQSYNKTASEVDNLLRTMGTSRMARALSSSRAKGIDANGMPTTKAGAAYLQQQQQGLAQQAILQDESFLNAQKRFADQNLPIAERLKAYNDWNEYFTLNVLPRYKASMPGVDVDSAFKSFTQPIEKALQARDKAVEEGSTEWFNPAMKAIGRGFTHAGQGIYSGYLYGFGTPEEQATYLKEVQAERAREAADMDAYEQDQMLQQQQGVGYFGRMGGKNGGIVRNLLTAGGEMVAPMVATTGIGMINPVAGAVAGGAMFGAQNIQAATDIIANDPTKTDAEKLAAYNSAAIPIAGGVGLAAGTVAPAIGKGAMKLVGKGVSLIPIKTSGNFSKALMGETSPTLGGVTGATVANAGENAFVMGANNAGTNAAINIGFDRPWNQDIMNGTGESMGAALALAPIFGGARAMFRPTVRPTAPTDETGAPKAQGKPKPVTPTEGAKTTEEVKTAEGAKATQEIVTPTQGTEAQQPIGDTADLNAAKEAIAAAGKTQTSEEAVAGTTGIQDENGVTTGVNTQSIQDRIQNSNVGLTSTEKGHLVIKASDPQYTESDFDNTLQVASHLSEEQRKAKGNDVLSILNQQRDIRQRNEAEQQQQQQQQQTASTVSEPTNLSNETQQPQVQRTRITEIGEKVNTDSRLNTAQKTAFVNLASDQSYTDADFATAIETIVNQPKHSKMKVRQALDKARATRIKNEKTTVKQQPAQPAQPVVPPVVAQNKGATNVQGQTTKASDTNGTVQRVATQTGTPASTETGTHVNTQTPVGTGGTNEGRGISRPKLSGKRPTETSENDVATEGTNPPKTGGQNGGDSELTATGSTPASKGTRSTTRQADGSSSDIRDVKNVSGGETNVVPTISDDNPMGVEDNTDVRNAQKAAENAQTKAQPKTPPKSAAQNNAAPKRRKNDPEGNFRRLFGISDDSNIEFGEATYQTKEDGERYIKVDVTDKTDPDNPVEKTYTISPDDTGNFDGKHVLLTESKYKENGWDTEPVGTKSISMSEKEFEAYFKDADAIEKKFTDIQESDGGSESSTPLADEMVNQVLPDISVTQKGEQPTYAFSVPNDQGLSVSLIFPRSSFRGLIYDPTNKTISFINQKGENIGTNIVEEVAPEDFQQLRTELLNKYGTGTKQTDTEIKKTPLPKENTEIVDDELSVPLENEIPSMKGHKITKMHAGENADEPEGFKNNVSVSFDNGSHLFMTKISEDTVSYIVRDKNGNVIEQGDFNEEGPLSFDNFDSYVQKVKAYEARKKGAPVQQEPVEAPNEEHARQAANLLKQAGVDTVRNATAFGGTEDGGLITWEVPGKGSVIAGYNQGQLHVILNDGKTRTEIGSIPFTETEFKALHAAAHEKAEVKGAVKEQTPATQETKKQSSITNDEADIAEKGDALFRRVTGIDNNDAITYVKSYINDATGEYVVDIFTKNKRQFSIGRNRNTGKVDIDEYDPNSPDDIMDTVEKNMSTEEYREILNIGRKCSNLFDTTNNKQLITQIVWTNEKGQPIYYKPEASYASITFGDGRIVDLAVRQVGKKLWKVVERVRTDEAEFLDENEFGSWQWEDAKTPIEKDLPILNRQFNSKAEANLAIKNLQQKGIALTELQEFAVKKPELVINKTNTVEPPVPAAKEEQGNTPNVKRILWNNEFGSTNRVQYRAQNSFARLTLADGSQVDIAFKKINEGEWGVFSDKEGKTRFLPETFRTKREANQAVAKLVPALENPAPDQIPAERWNKLSLTDKRNLIEHPENIPAFVAAKKQSNITSSANTEDAAQDAAVRKLLEAANKNKPEVPVTPINKGPAGKTIEERLEEANKDLRKDHSKGTHYFTTTEPALAYVLGFNPTKEPSRYIPDDNITLEYDSKNQGSRKLGETSSLVITVSGKHLPGGSVTIRNPEYSRELALIDGNGHEIGRYNSNSYKTIQAMFSGMKLRKEAARIANAKANDGVPVDTENSGITRSGVRQAEHPGTPIIFDKDTATLEGMQRKFTTASPIKDVGFVGYEKDKPIPAKVRVTFEDGSFTTLTIKPLLKNDNSDTQTKKHSNAVITSDDPKKFRGANTEALKFHDVHDARKFLEALRDKIKEQHGKTVTTSDGQAAFDKNPTHYVGTHLDAMDIETVRPLVYGEPFSGIKLKLKGVSQEVQLKPQTAGKVGKKTSVHEIHAWVDGEDKGAIPFNLGLNELNQYRATSQTAARFLGGLLETKEPNPRSAQKNLKRAGENVTVDLNRDAESLSNPVGEDEKTTLEDNLQDRKAVNPADEVEVESIRKALTKADQNWIDQFAIDHGLSAEDPRVIEEALKALQKFRAPRNPNYISDRVELVDKRDAAQAAKTSLVSILFEKLTNLFSDPRLAGERVHLYEQMKKENNKRADTEKFLDDKANASTIAAYIDFKTLRDLLTRLRRDLKNDKLLYQSLLNKAGITDAEERLLTRSYMDTKTKIVPNEDLLNAIDWQEHNELASMGIDHMTREEVNDIITKFNSLLHWSDEGRKAGKTMIDVYDTPEDARRAGLNVEGDRTLGVYDPRTGKVALFLNNLYSTGEVEFALFHEVVVHGGLRRLFGDKLQAALLTWWDKWLGTKGLGERLQADYEHWLKTSGKPYKERYSQNDLENKALLIEEYLAHICSERGLGKFANPFHETMFHKFVRFVTNLWNKIMHGDEYHNFDTSTPTKLLTSLGRYAFEGVETAPKGLRAKIMEAVGNMDPDNTTPDVGNIFTYQRRMQDISRALKKDPSIQNLDTAYKAIVNQDRPEVETIRRYQDALEREQNERLAQAELDDWKQESDELARKRLSEKTDADVEDEKAFARYLKELEKKKTLTKEDNGLLSSIADDLTNEEERLAKLEISEGIARGQHVARTAWLGITTALNRIWKDSKANFFEWAQVYNNDPTKSALRNVIVSAFNLRPARIEGIENQLGEPFIKQTNAWVTPIATRLGMSRNDTLRLIGRAVQALNTRSGNDVIFQRNYERFMELLKKQDENNGKLSKAEERELHDVSRQVDAMERYRDVIRDEKTLGKDEYWKAQQLRTRTGWTDAEADMELKAIIDQGVTLKEVEEFADMINDYHRDYTSKFARDNKLVPEDYEMPKFERYAPATGRDKQVLFGAENDAIGIINPGSLHKMRGRLSECDDAYTATLNTITALAKQEGSKDAAGRFGDMYLKQLKTGEDYGLMAIKYNDVFRDINRARSTEEVMEAINFIKNGGFVCDFGGEKYIVKFRNDWVDPETRLTGVELNESLTATPRMDNAFGKMMTTSTGYFGQALTRFKPLFAPANMTRDIFERMFAAASDSYQLSDGTYVSGPQIAMGIIKNIVSGRLPRMYFNAITGRAPKDSREYQLWEMYKNLGGKQDLSTYGILHRSDIQSTADTRPEHVQQLLTKLHEQSPELYKILAQTAPDTAAKVLHTLDVWNDAFNSLPGFAHFVTLVEAGVAPKAAANASLEFMNLHQTGTATPILRCLYPFVKPTIQGAASMMRTLGFAYDPRGFWHPARVKSYGFVLGTIAAGAMIKGLVEDMFGEDENGNKKIDAMSMDNLASFIPIPIGDNNYFRLNIGFGMPQAVMTMLYGFDRVERGLMTPGDFVARLLLTTVKNVAPGNWPAFNPSDNPTAFLMQTFAPAFMRPIVESATNTTFTGNTLVYPSADRSVSKAYSGGARALKVYHDMAKTIFDYTGLDLAPEQVQNIINNILVGPLGLVRTALEANDPGKNSTNLYKETHLDPLFYTIGASMHMGKMPNTAMQLFYAQNDKYNKILRDNHINLTQHPKGLSGADLTEWQRGALEETGLSEKDISNILILNAARRAMQGKTQEINKLLKQGVLTQEETEKLMELFNQLDEFKQSVYVSTLGALE